MRAEYTIEFQYQAFLKRVALSEDQMTQEQKLQVRMSFYAGSASLLFLLRGDIAELPMEDGAAVLDEILKELKAHAETLKEEIKKQKA